MNRDSALLLALLLVTPLGLAHKPPGPVATCQPYTGDTYHDYVANWNGAFASPIGDGNLSDCGVNAMDLQILGDNGSTCQFLKTIRDDPSQPDEARHAAADAHSLLCRPHTVLLNQPFMDFDGEYDYASGGAVLAVDTGDQATWGAYVCWGMTGHHTQNVYALNWPNGVGPAFSVTADHSRTPPSPGPKGSRPDCGDTIVEPCDPSPPEASTQPFPANLVFDTVNSQLWALFGPSGNGTTCNLNDCAERNRPVAPATTRSNPSGATHLVTKCAPGIDGTLVVFIESDFDAPDVPMMGHVWTY